MKKYLSATLLSLVIVLSVPASAFAHVTVTPKEAAVGARTTFTMSVPNEKDVAVTELRLAVPAGLQSVQPTVHSGWTIATTVDTAKNVTEIRWTGGTIPAGQRDDFTFRGQAPAKAASLEWKAYQTYADGITVAWDQKPDSSAAESESETSGPFSVTNVVDDLKQPTSTSGNTENSTASSDKHAVTDNAALGISLLALILSIAALAKHRKTSSPERASR